MGLDIQPFIKGVTSYSPNRRYQNYQYRNMAQVSYLTCAAGGASCSDATVVTVGRDTSSTTLKTLIS